MEVTGISDPENKTADSLEPNDVSVASDHSRRNPPNFSSEEENSKLWTKTEAADSLEPSDVSVASDHSRRNPPNFSSEEENSELGTETEAAVSLEPSDVSVASDHSRRNPPNFSGEAATSDTTTKTEAAVSLEPSDVSVASDHSRRNPPNFSSEAVTSDPTSETEAAVSLEPSDVSVASDHSRRNPPNFSSEAVTSDPIIQKKKKNIPIKDLNHVFKELQNKIFSLVKSELNTFKRLLSPDCPEYSEREMEYDYRQGVLGITLHILRDMEETDLANTLRSKLAPACHQNFKSKLRDKCKRINEGISGHGHSALLNEIYTELYITEEGSGEVKQEHEVKQIEAESRKRTTQETPIKCSDIFKPLPDQKQPIRTVLTKGVAGIGKTVSVQKLILDWAEEKENQDFLFIFPLPFRELNLMKEKRLSLVNLLQRFFPETQDLKPSHYKCYKIMFIFDGLDECRLPLDFQKNENLVDIEEQTSVDVLLTNLIKGNLLPSALLWITSRPAAMSQIPSEYVDLLTEVRGFSDNQKQEYFKKRISDQVMANKIITHIKSSRSLYIMCHIPVFCWIAATVLERMLSETESEETPKTLTQMFTHFLIFQMKNMSQKYSGTRDLDPHQTRKTILALGKLAFQQLEKGNLIFYEEDLRLCGIDIREVSVYSGVCTQIFREEYELHMGKVFSFVHLSIQEFFAALYVFLKRKNLNQQASKLRRLFSRPTMSDFLNSAVDKALQSESGHLDLFLRFLLGLSLESNQNLLQDVLRPRERSSHSNEKTVKYIKERINTISSPEKSINLFHCLNELKDHSLVQEVQKYLSGGADHCLYRARLSHGQWSALVFVLLNSEEDLDEFYLSKYDPSEECLLRLLPVVKASKKAVLASCNLGEKTCENLGSVFNLENCSLKELDLSNNDLQDSGVELLCAGLKSSHCKLQILRFTSCNLGVKTCKNLGSVLNQENCSLIELDLSNNDLQDSGVELLSAGLKSHCKLQKLRLASCNLGEKTCENLGSVLNQENCSLMELDLSNNDLQDSGVELLCAGLKSSHCKLQILRLSGNMVTEKGCFSLASALNSNTSLKELDLSYNHPGESGEELLSVKQKDPCCKLETLRLEHGGKIRMKPGVKKWACDLTLDPNTSHTRLALSEGNRKVVCVTEEQSYPDHPERFSVCWQVMSKESLTGRCYWEADCSWKVANVALTYKTISRKDGGPDCGFGRNENSWSLICTDYRYSVQHNNNSIDLSHSPSNSRRTGVYVDYPAGTLSFYSVCPDTDTITHLHTFNTTFTKPLYAGFWLPSAESSVCVCKIE